MITYLKHFNRNMELIVMYICLHSYELWKCIIHHAPQFDHIQLVNLK